jgi:hypothetical protein
MGRKPRQLEVDIERSPKIPPAGGGRSLCPRDLGPALLAILAREARGRRRRAHLPKSWPFPDLYRRRPRLLVPGAYRDAPLNNLYVIMIRFLTYMDEAGRPAVLSTAQRVTGARSPSLGKPPSRSRKSPKEFPTTAPIERQRCPKILSLVYAL